MITLIFYVLLAAGYSKDGVHIAGQTFVSQDECELAGRKLIEAAKVPHSQFLCKPLAVHINNTDHTVKTEIM